MRRHWSGVFCLLVLGGASCTSATSPAGRIYVLREHRAQWRAAGIHAYAFNLQTQAMLSGPPVRIEVRADTVARVVNRATGAELTVRDWPTVDSLFVSAEDLLRGDNYHPTIRYAPRLGYPVEIDAASDIPDAGYSVIISDFVVNHYGYGPD